MTLPRGSAQKGSDVRLGILFRWDGQPVDPHHVRQVEIIATDGETVLETLASFDHEPETGEYYVTASGALLTTVGRHIDRWYYTWVDGEGEQTATQDFYVQETAALEHYGPDIQAGVGYLKGVPPLASAPQDGLTQADLDAAMNAADAMIESIFAAGYDLSCWRAAPPPLVSMLWEMLAAAKVLEFTEVRFGAPKPEAESALRLIRSARELVDKLIHGWPERLSLRDDAGNVIRPLRNRSLTVPRAADATSDLF